MPGPTAAEYEILKRVVMDFEVIGALQPIHVPKTYSLTDGDVGLGHLVDNTKVIIPRMGPNRIGIVDEPLVFYGGDSYIHGGGAAAGHLWAVYEYDVVSDEVYEASRGAQVTTTGGTVFTWIPSAAGRYSVELHLTDALEGDGINAPLGYGVRFVTVYELGADGFLTATDLEELLSLKLSGSLGASGWNLDMDYGQPNDVTAGRQTIDQNQRVVFRKTEYHGAQEFTWEPQNGLPLGYYSPEILASGLNDATNLSEQTFNHTQTFAVTDARRVLELLKMPSTPKSVEGYDLPMYTTFIDELFYQDFIAPEIADPEWNGTFWWHRVESMKFSDPILHIIARHTNFCDFWDLGMWQNDTDNVPSIGAEEGDVFSWLKKNNSARLGIEWCDRKSTLYVGPNLNLRGEEYWASAPGLVSEMFKLDADFIDNISIQRRQPMVGQVYLETVDIKEVLVSELRELIGPDESEDYQSIFRKIHRGVHPITPVAGKRVFVPNMVYFEQGQLQTLAYRMFKMLNFEFAVSADILFLPGLDTAQTVKLVIDSRSDEPSVVSWATGKFFYIDSYSHDIDFENHNWGTKLNLIEIVEAPGR